MCWRGVPSFSSESCSTDSVTASSISAHCLQLDRPSVANLGEYNMKKKSSPFISFQFARENILCTLFQTTQGTVLTALPGNQGVGMNTSPLLNLLKTRYSACYQKKEKKGVFKKHHERFTAREKLRAGWEGVFTQALSQETVFSTDPVIQGAHL